MAPELGLKSRWGAAERQHHTGVSCGCVCGSHGVSLDEEVASFDFLVILGRSFCPRKDLGTHGLPRGVSLVHTPQELCVLTVFCLVQGFFRASRSLGDIALILGAI